MSIKIFRITPGDDIVAEPTLEKVKCHCKGKLKITATEATCYSNQKAYILTCQSCGGKYAAHQIIDNEIENSLT